MYKVNRFEKSFGPAGFNAGIALFASGLVLIFFSLSGVVVLLIGAFIGFTAQASLIDYKSKRVKYGTFFFGIIPSGSWLNVEPEIKLEIKKYKASYHAYSLSNRVLHTSENDYRIVLCDNTGKEIIPLKRYPNKELAEKEIVSLAKRLGTGLG